MLDKEIDKYLQNTYDDGNIPEIDLPGRADAPSGSNRYGDSPIDDPPGQNSYGDVPIGDPGNSHSNPSGDNNSNPTGDNNLVWVTPPVLLSQSEGPAPNAIGGI